MISRRQSAALYPLGLNFDAFLYAEVGDDQQGGLLSVLSALARVGVDPWDQAALLARSPLDVGVRALSALLARLPDGSGRPADPVGVATRLISLLPHGSPALAPPTSAITQPSTGTGRSRLFKALFYLFLLLLGSQLLMLTQHRLEDGSAEAAPLSIKH